VIFDAVPVVPSVLRDVSCRPGAHALFTPRSCEQGCLLPFLAGAMARAWAVGDDWRHSQPLPTSQAIHGYWRRDGSAFVAVGRHGTLLSASAGRHQLGGRGRQPPSSGPIGSAWCGPARQFAASVLGLKAFAVDFARR